MAQAASIAELAALIQGMGARLDGLEQRLQTTPGGQCSADFPHPDRLIFMRSPAGNHYVCSCGKRYRKDGRGGLAEMN